jgi:hypothetical protein
MIMNTKAVQETSNPMPWDSDKKSKKKFPLKSPLKNSIMDRNTE